MAAHARFDCSALRKTEAPPWCRLRAAVRHGLRHPPPAAESSHKLLRNGAFHRLRILCGRAERIQGKDVAARGRRHRRAATRQQSADSLQQPKPLCIGTLHIMNQQVQGPPHTPQPHTHSPNPHPPTLPTPHHPYPPVAPGTTTLTSEDLAVVMSVLSSEPRGR